MKSPMSRQAIFFTGPRDVLLVEEPLAAPGPGQVLVQTVLTAISPGTEMLIYRGEAPEELPADESISALNGDLRFPLKYGYCAVGRVVEAGDSPSKELIGRMVFSFQPHQTYFLAAADEVMQLPDDTQPEDAVFLPNIESALNFVMDGAPLIGERVVVFGQGIVGLLTTALLARMPLAALVTLDRYPCRREASVNAGATASLDPRGAGSLVRVAELLADQQRPGADLVYELSGAPSTLNEALSVVGYGGRLVIGSWYGNKRTSLDLGGRFHRSRIRLISSQVSTIAPELSGRWTKARRFALAWRMMQEMRPSRFITHSFPFSRAADAYRLLDRSPQDTIQVVLTY